MPTEQPHQASRRVISNEFDDLCDIRQCGKPAEGIVFGVGAMCSYHLSLWEPEQAAAPEPEPGPIEKARRRDDLARRVRLALLTGPDAEWLERKITELMEWSDEQRRRQQAG